MKEIRMLSKLMERISEGEGRTMEFKQSVPSEAGRYVRTAAAFANGFGGEIVFGVSDSGEVVGIGEDDLGAFIERVSHDIGAFTDPRVGYDVSAVNADGRLLIVASIDQGRSKPYGSTWGDDGGRAYIRHGRNTFAATEEEIAEMRLECSPEQYDRLPYIAPDGGSGLDDGCVSILLDGLRYAGAAKPTFERLVEMGLVVERGGRYVATRGFELLTRNRDGFEVSCVRLTGPYGVEILDRQVYAGSIMDQITGAEGFLRRNIRCSGRIRGFVREDAYEYPIEAVREAVLNAVVHRSYIIPGPVQVSVFDDRLEVRSPGQLNITASEIHSGWSRPRNTAVRDYLREVKMVEGIGTGFRRMWACCEAQGAPAPEIDDSGDGVVVTFRRASGGGAGGRRGEGAKAPGTMELRMLDSMSENPDVTIPEIAESLGVSKPYVSKMIRRMKDLGYLDRDQTVRRGGWTVLTDR